MEKPFNKENMNKLISEIDWSRMHRPQADGYDTQMLVALATERYGFKKLLPAPDTPALFGGRVAVIHEEHDRTEYLHAAPFDHPNIAAGAGLLEKEWPEMAAQCGALLQEIGVISDTRYADRMDLGGCTCGDRPEFGGIYGTVEGPIGFAHSIVHELGHWKLKAMGVYLEYWDNLVANSFEERFASPIRKDIPRPMGACIQAQYSYLHVLEMEIRAFKAGLVSDMMETNLGRMTAGRETLKAWKPDVYGVPFAAAIDSWTGELLSEATALLNKPA